MNKTIWFASNNKNKIFEIKNFFAKFNFNVKSLLDLEKPLNIIESGKTYEENALIKARALADILDDEAFVIADDTGLEIAELDNFPGIYSDRWRKEMNFHQAMEVILQKLANKKNRKAKMITVIALINHKNKITKTFVGELEGMINSKITSDENGFGYDGFFYLPSKKLTLHEISRTEKNQISHRGQALKALLTYLVSNNFN